MLLRLGLYDPIGKLNVRFFSLKRQYFETRRIWEYLKQSCKYGRGKLDVLKKGFVFGKIRATPER